MEYGQKAKRKWFIAECETGNVIFHNPWMVHASYKDKDPENRIRLATDLKFHETGKPFGEGWMKVYRPLDEL